VIDPTLAKSIKLVAFDVDGVLTDGGIFLGDVDGRRLEFKRYDIQDGLGIAQSRFKNGATSELDVMQATTLLENTRASIPTLQVSLQQAQNALCTLLGRVPGP